MNFTPLYLDTFIPEYPKILNGNFASFSRYLDIFYDGSLGILTKPLTTTGRVKGARGEFVTVVVDNLIVKNQFTNLFDNNTTADYNFYKLYVDPPIAPRDPCTAVDYWPKENYSGYKVIDVNQPYYKITNEDPIILSTETLSQVVGIYLDPSLIDPFAPFLIMLDPSQGTIGAQFVHDTSVGDPATGTGYYIEFICTGFDPSWGAKWEQYKYGDNTASGAGGGGGSIGGGGTLNQLAVFSGPTTIGDSGIYAPGGGALDAGPISATTITADGIITLTNQQVKGVALPTDPSDAINEFYSRIFATNASVNAAGFAEQDYVDGSLARRDSSIDWLFANITPGSLTQAYVDGSLYLRDLSINYLYNNKVNNASLGLYATNASVNAAGFVKGASLGIYATNASVNAAGFAKQTYVDGSLARRDSSIDWLFANSLTTTALGPYATNASIASADFAKNASLGLYATNASVNAALVIYATNSSIAAADFAKNASLGLYATNASINDALGIYSTNSSINLALVQFIRSSSTGTGLIWNLGLLDVSIAGISDAATNASVNYYNAIQDASIEYIINYYLPLQYFNNTILPTLVTNASLCYLTKLCGYISDASVQAYLTNYYDIPTIDAMNFATNASVNAAFDIVNYDILSLDYRVTELENSTGAVTKIYVDGSLAERDLIIDSLDASLYDLTLYVLNLSSNTYSKTQIDASFGLYATNASVNAAGFAKNASLGLYALNSSVNSAFSANTIAHNSFTSSISGLQNRMLATETSTNINTAEINLRLREASINTLTGGFIWAPGGVLEVSINAVSLDYIDGSLATRDSSIDWLFANKVNKAGDTMTGGLIINSGGLSVTGDASFYNNINIGNHLHVEGNLTVDGSFVYTSYEAIDISTSFILLNTGLTGAPPSNLQSGIVVTRGDQDPYIFVFDQDTETFRIGITYLETSTHYNDVSTQAVATREDSPLNRGYAYWDASLFMFKTFDLKGYIDGSLAVRIKESSLGTDFAWNAGLLEVSILVPTADAWNGLSKSVDGSIGLGGTLIQSTTIDASDYDLTISAPRAYSYISAAYVNLHAQSLPGSNFTYTDLLLQGNQAQLVLNSSLGIPGGIIVDPGRVYFHNSDNATAIAHLDASGFEYSSDLSSTWSDRSLVDRGYVKNNFATNSSLGIYATNASINAAGFAKNASLGLYLLKTDPSVQVWNNLLPNSLSFNPTTGIITHQTKDSTSFTTISLFGALLPNASIGSGLVWNTITKMLDVSVAAGGVSQAYIDGSLAYFIRSSSTGSTLKWVGGVLDVSVAAVTSLSALTDVSIVSITDKNLLQYDSGSGKWKNISMVDGSAYFWTLTTPLLRESSLNSTRFKWSGGLLEPSTSLSLLTDVSIVSLTNNDFLKYDSGTGKWKNVSGLDASAYYQAKIQKQTIPGTGSTGNAGDWSYDSSYLYVCTSTNKWGRILLDYGF